MGDLRFKFPHANEFDVRVWNTAYITGIEGIPWHCHHQLNGDQFSIGREIDESGKLNIVWPTRSAGNLCLSTTSLRIADTPYSLAVEIARGTLSRLKSQTSEWQRVGLKLPASFFPLAEEALSQLLHALTARADDQQQTSYAQAAIDLAIESSLVLCNAFALQALEARRQSETRMATLLGACLCPQIELESVGRGLDAAFNLVGVAPDLGSVESASGKREFAAFDRQVEWATSKQKKVCVGPLVNFRRGCLPQWMVLLDQGFESILEVACQHVRSVVERYRGKTHIWNCATGLNTPSEMGWNDEEVLRMAVSLIETVRRTDDRTPVLLTIEQPWSEYLRDEANGISPMHFADALIRADLGLSGLALELDFDLWPSGSFPRDPIELSRLIDRWSMLGLPLMVNVTSPTDAVSPEGSDRVSAWSTAGRGAGVVDPQTILSMLLSKPSVHAIQWNDLSDQAPSAAAGSGLWDASGQAKPLLNKLAQFRRDYLH